MANNSGQHQQHPGSRMDTGGITYEYEEPPTVMVAGQRLVTPASVHNSDEMDDTGDVGRAAARVQSDISSATSTPHDTAHDVAMDVTTSSSSAVAHSSSTAYSPSLPASSGGSVQRQPRGDGRQSASMPSDFRPSSGDGGDRRVAASVGAGPLSLPAARDLPSRNLPSPSNQDYRSLGSALTLSSRQQQRSPVQSGHVLSTASKDPRAVGTPPDGEHSSMASLSQNSSAHVSYHSSTGVTGRGGGGHGGGGMAAGGGHASARTSREPMSASAASLAAPPSSSSSSSSSSLSADRRQHSSSNHSGVRQPVAANRSYLPATGGYPVELAENVNHLNSYLCSHCKYLLRDPIQANCGHRFCSSCYQLLLSEPSPKCPGAACTEILLPSDFHDVHAARDIGAMRVHCVHKHSGCEWQGKVEDLETHLSACAHTKEKCPNPGCTEMLGKTEMLQHAQQECPFRVIPCDYCHERIAIGNQQVHFNEQCMSLPVNCQYECGSRIGRHEIEDHLRRCKNAPALCKYNPYGCQYPKATRHEICVHEERDAHMHLDIMWRQMNDMEHVVNQLVDAVKALQQNTSKEMIRRECMACCESFSDVIAPRGRDSSGGGGGVPSAAASAVVIQDVDSRLTFVEELVRVHSGDMQKLNSDLQACSRASQSGSATSLTTITKTLENLEVSVLKQGESMADLSLRLDIMDVKETDGVLVWKITDLRRRIQEARNKKTPSIYSAPFYTSSAGYKMCCRVYLDGDGIGRNTHISVFFVLMQGEFDNLLVWPFPFKVTLSLLSQNESEPQKERSHFEESFRPGQNSAAFQKPTTNMNTGTGCPKFAPREILNQGSSYVRDDSIFIKVAVSHPKDTYLAPDKKPPC
ncbi:TNF receptor-associated factor 2-like [Sycon ciliatum]|uniref:TNF receptor-associated factor 2-like n=1 Tax=Sycon ciliatum TaxID=27933 RepID=UPI0031F664B3